MDVHKRVRVVIRERLTVSTQYLIQRLKNFNTLRRCTETVALLDLAVLRANCCLSHGGELKTLLKPGHTL